MPKSRKQRNNTPRRWREFSLQEEMNGDEQNDQTTEVTNQSPPLPNVREEPDEQVPSCSYIYQSESVSPLMESKGDNNEVADDKDDEENKKQVTEVIDISCEENQPIIQKSEPEIIDLTGDESVEMPKGKQQSTIERGGSKSLCENDNSITLNNEYGGETSEEEPLLPTSYSLFDNMEPIQLSRMERHRMHHLRNVISLHERALSSIARGEAMSIDTRMVLPTDFNISQQLHTIGSPMYLDSPVLREYYTHTFRDALGLNPLPHNSNRRRPISLFDSNWTVEDTFLNRGFETRQQPRSEGVNIINENNIMDQSVNNMDDDEIEVLEVIRPPTPNVVHPVDELGILRRYAEGDWMRELREAQVLIESIDNNDGDYNAVEAEESPPEQVEIHEELDEMRELDIAIFVRDMIDQEDGNYNEVSSSEEEEEEDKDDEDDGGPDDIPPPIVTILEE